MSGWKMKPRCVDLHAAAARSKSRAFQARQAMDARSNWGVDLISWRENMEKPTRKQGFKHNQLKDVEPSLHSWNKAIQIQRMGNKYDAKQTGDSMWHNKNGGYDLASAGCDLWK